MILAVISDTVWLALISATATLISTIVLAIIQMRTKDAVIDTAHHADGEREKLHKATEQAAVKVEEVRNTLATNTQISDRKIDCLERTSQEVKEKAMVIEQHVNGAASQAKALIAAQEGQLTMMRETISKMETAAQLVAQAAATARLSVTQPPPEASAITSDIGEGTITIKKLTQIEKHTEATAENTARTEESAARTEESAARTEESAARTEEHAANAIKKPK